MEQLLIREGDKWWPFTWYRRLADGRVVGEYHNGTEESFVFMTKDSPNLRSDTEHIVCDDILSRQRLGVAKYGKTVAETRLELRDWLIHAYQECLDQAIYLRRAIQEIDNGK